MPGVLRRHFLFGTLLAVGLGQKNKWRIPAIELEYNVPDGSDAVQEVRKCVDFCRRVLAT